MSTTKQPENMAENTTAGLTLKDLYPHYFRSIPKGMTHLDVYAVLKLFECDDAAIAHALKKLLCAGKRGAKDRAKDLREARDSITRALELDEAFGQVSFVGPPGEDADGVDGVLGLSSPPGLPGPTTPKPVQHSYHCRPGLAASDAARLIQDALMLGAYTSKDPLLVSGHPVGTAASMRFANLPLVKFSDV